MKVIICENEPSQRKFLQNEIIKYSTFHESSIELVLSTSDPNDVLSFISNNRADCYFLDIELESEINGIELAYKVRQCDPFANIIFVTTSADKLKLTFTYKLAALDFIVKEHYEILSSQVKEALQAAFEKYKQLGDVDKSKFFQIKVGERLININLDDIYYFETAVQSHKLSLHEKNGYYEFYGKLKDLENLDERFFRCHKSFIVNLQHIKEVDKNHRILKMKDNTRCNLSFRMMKELQTRLANL